MPTRTIVNWDRTLRSTPTVVGVPRSEDDASLRRACDPDGLFRDAFVDRVFGLEG